MDARLRALLGSSTNKLTEQLRECARRFLAGDRAVVPAAAKAGKLDILLHETALPEDLFQLLVLELDYNTGKTRKLNRKVRRRKKKAAA